MPEFTIVARPVKQTWVLITPGCFRLVKKKISQQDSCSQWCRTLKDMDLRVLALGQQKKEKKHYIKSFENPSKKQNMIQQDLGRSQFSLCKSEVAHKS